MTSEISADDQIREITERLNDYFFNEERDGDDEEDAQQFASDAATLLDIIGRRSQSIGSLKLEKA